MSDKLLEALLPSPSRRAGFFGRQASVPTKEKLSRSQMHVHDPEILPNLRLSCFSAVGDGMHVEVARPDGAPSPDPLITFREDEELGMQVVLHGSGRDVVFSLAELQRAIALAASEVHRESFYE